MKFIRFEHQGAARYGRVVDDQVTALSAAPWDAGVDQEVLALADVKLLAPLAAPRIFGTGYNYDDHIAETNHDRPEYPVLFMKPSTALIGPEDPIHYPPDGTEVHYEGEMAVVIGKKARHLTLDTALDCVFGYTCANDVSDRTVQRRESAFGCLLVGKGMDSFCPLGPWIVPGLDPTDLTIETRVNGVVRQSGSTAKLVFPTRELLVYITQYITLLPGDVILTGTPSGIGPIAPGDRVEITVAGIGTLGNPVIAENLG